MVSVAHVYKKMIHIISDCQNLQDKRGCFEQKEVGGKVNRIHKTRQNIQKVIWFIVIKLQRVVGFLKFKTKLQLISLVLCVLYENQNRPYGAMLL